MKKLGERSNILFVLGYGLYKAAGSGGYLSAMGTAGDNMGFVTSGAFMLANTSSSVFVCLIVAGLGFRSVRFPKKPVALLAYALLILDFLLVPLLGSPIVAGIAYGVSTMLLSIAWFATCVERMEEPSIAITCALLASTIIQTVVVSYELSSTALSAALLAASALSFVVFGASRGESDKRLSIPRLHSRAASAFFPALLCLMVCVFVVGVSNVAMLGSPLERLFEGVNMQMTYLAAAIVAAAIVFCGAALPDPVKAYTMALPVFFVVFSLIPIVGEDMGAYAGSIMVGCYQAIAIIFAAFSVKLAATERLNPYAIAPLCFGGSSLALALGLSVGALLGMLGGRGLPLSVLVMLMAVYPLGLVLFFVTRRRRAVSAAGSGGVSDGPHAPIAFSETEGEGADAAFRRRAADIALTYGLTKREEEILLYVARGRSARVISEELFISENTTWSHIKRIYTKVGVHSKQAVLDLFEKDGMSSR